MLAVFFTISVINQQYILILDGTFHTALRSTAEKKTLYLSEISGYTVLLTLQLLV